MAKTATASQKMSKSAIAAHLAEKAGVSKKQATALMEAQAELAYKQAKNSFTIPGIGKLVLVNRKARIGRNPAQRAYLLSDPGGIAEQPDQSDERGKAGNDRHQSEEGDAGRDQREIGALHRGADAFEHAPPVAERQLVRAVAEPLLVCRRGIVHVARKIVRHLTGRARERSVSAHAGLAGNVG